MRNISWLGLGFLAPALIMVVLFFLAPVVLTGTFAFTNMSTSTGITGGAYKLGASNLRALADAGVPDDTLALIEDAGYRIDEAGLAALARDYGDSPARALRAAHAGAHFTSRRDIESALKDLRLPELRSTRDRKAAAALFKRSILNERYETELQFRAALSEAGIPPADIETVVTEAYTGWVWTTRNLDLMFRLPATWHYALNTLQYVGLTLAFNVAFGLFLAIGTFYLPKGQAAAFRAIWFLPRILPPVLYALMWKWFTWDTGFISMLVQPLGIAPRNWMMDSAFNAWVVVVLINGFVGASMGMILFSSAIRAIPSSMLYASEVDGANRWQQVRYIILPQLRWPILFVTSYQTLSLLTSFEFILLSTRGGPGSSTEVWALAAYHTALNTYGGNLEYGMGAAFALVLVVIGIIASLLYLRVFDFKTLVAKPRIEG